MNIVRGLMLLLVAVISLPATADVDVLACEPEWAALAVAIGGEAVSVYSATTALQDAHKVQARPSLIARARGADLLICSGAELEVGWLPLLLRKSGNGAIQPGAIGHLMAADHVPLLGKLEKVDRSMGDVHAAGNPHFGVDPRRILPVAKVLSSRLEQLDPANALAYQQRLAAFETELAAHMQRWQPLVSRIQGMRIVVYHDSWVYLRDWLGLQQLATLEPKPGVPPSTRHLATVLAQLRQQRADAVVYAAFQDDRAVLWLADKTAVKPLKLWLSPHDWSEENALFKWYEETLQALATGR